MNPHQFPLTLPVRGLLAILLGVAAPMAQALTVSAGTQVFDFSKTVADEEVAVGNGNASFGTASTNVQFQKFDPLTGRLKGVNIGLSSNLSVSSRTTSTDGPNSNPFPPVLTTQGFASAQPYIIIPGLPSGGYITWSNTVAGSSCTGTSTAGCNGPFYYADSNPFRALSTGTSVPGGTFGGLAEYTGTGLVSLTPSMSMMVNQMSSNFTGTESTTGTARWQGLISLNYLYDLHALASFGTTSNAVTALTLDFGTLYKNDAALGQAFQISNGSGSSERVGLQLDGVDATGDFARFDTGLSSFSDLAGGAQFASLADFDTSELGNFEANYTLRFSDAGDPSLDAFSAQTLLLTLKGNVIDRISGNTVPEPSALALLGLGLLGLALSRRKAYGTATN